MKTKSTLSIFLLTVLIVAQSGCGVPQLPVTVVTPAACVDFSGYAHDTKFGNPFSLNNYQFTGLGAEFEPFVNAGGNVGGLQFTDAGLEVDLPGPASAVTLDAASFTSKPLTLTALDSSGVAVANATAPADNTVHSITLNGSNIVIVTITGGGYEGVLVKICSS